MTKVQIKSEGVEDAKNTKKSSWFWFATMAFSSLEDFVVPQ